MSVAELSADITIPNVVEAMLPRFSDRRLGLLIHVRMGFDDFGYAADGNTLEREPLHVTKACDIIYNRPSNYTKVFSWFPAEDAIGLDSWSQYAKPQPQEWKLESDHDSCWRNINVFTDMYFAGTKPFMGREVSGKKMAPRDVHHFCHIESTKYVELEVCEQKDKTADRWSKEGRIWFIQHKDLPLHRLESIASPSEKDMTSSGVLIKGSEEHTRYIEAVERTERKLAAEEAARDAFEMDEIE